MAVDIQQWLQPISASSPCGEDASFTEIFDQMREARRADDPRLSQGEWQTQLKVADWRRVLELGDEVLSRRSKDLQAAVWVCEALAFRHGLEGACAGFDLLAGLLDGYWEGLFPLPEGGDLEERAARLAWFNNYGAEALRKIPLSSGTPAMTLIDWQVSRDVDNLARQNSEAHQAALAEGKPSGESFDRALLATADETLRQWLGQAGQAMESFERMRGTINARFGAAAPGVSSVGDALGRMLQLLRKAAAAKGLVPESGQAQEAASTAQAHEGFAVPAAAMAATTGFQDKQAALRALAEIAGYFRRTEPHNPASYLLDRAVEWANMPLDVWLAEVVRDDAVLGAIKDRVGIRD